MAAAVLLIELERVKSALMLESMAWCLAKEICPTSVKAFVTSASIERVVVARDRKTEVAVCEAAERMKKSLNYLRGSTNINVPKPVGTLKFDITNTLKS